MGAFMAPITGAFAGDQQPVLASIRQFVGSLAV
jgi:hypothetical protein